ncbi:MAG TPA: glycoside hydrolase family 38 C-terminal domain-containing protein [Pseudonocardia sp.]
MHDDSGLVLSRVARFVAERLTPALHRASVPARVTAWTAPGEPVPFAEAVTQEYRPFAIGAAWGRPSGTVWFHVTGAVPTGWSNAELVVDLGTGPSPGVQAGGTVYSSEGVVLGGLEPRRPVPLDGPARALEGDPAGAAVDLYVEASVNPDVAGAWARTPPGEGLLFRLNRVDLALLDVDVWALVQDLWTLSGLVEALPGNVPRRAEVLRALADAVDAVDPDDVAATAAAGRAALADVLAKPARAGAHPLYAVGHAHVDSAWPSPVREVTRTFANALRLMDRDDAFVFAASSAQHYAWMRDHQPELFARIRKRAAEGRFVPVGGMWVEPDTNMPGGEAMARQFVLGAGFFRDELGVESDGVWLPDSFGYSAGLPQIAAAAGRRWVLIQKISRSEPNPFPHHTFAWEGIDGTRIRAHVTPIDSDDAGQARAQRQFTALSLVLFGGGVGGGGPTREMVAAAHRTRDLEGSPAAHLARPSEFFAAAGAENPTAPVWSGELSFEHPRGAYTAQAATKRGNRRSEHLLREAELWATTATVRTGAPYPTETLRGCWETVLLQQFHDILAGTSGAWAHRRAEREYARVADELESVIADALATLTGRGGREIAANAGPYAVDGVPGLGASTQPGTADDDYLFDVDDSRDADEPEPPAPGNTVLTSEGMRVVVDEHGLLTSIHDLVVDRELVPSGRAANLLQLHPDTPPYGEAGDADRPGHDLVEGEVTATDGGVRIVRTVGASTITQHVALRGRIVEIDTEVAWHERQKRLTLAFPLDVHADRAASETQFGHVYRPTPANTPMDAPRFETCAHRWVRVGEPGYGVAVANDATYGHDITRDGHTTTVRLSLLRAPLSPDPEADQGEHGFRVALRAGATIGDAVAEGYRLNLPLRRVRGANDIAPLVVVDDPAVVVEAVKLAEDGSGDVVVRLYEALGTRVRTRITPTFDHLSITETDLLEAALPDPVALEGNELSLRPLQIVTLRFVTP